MSRSSSGTTRPHACFCTGSQRARSTVPPTTICSATARRPNMRTSSTASSSASVTAGLSPAECRTYTSRAAAWTWWSLIRSSPARRSKHLKAHWLAWNRIPNSRRSLLDPRQSQGGCSKHVARLRIPGRRRGTRDGATGIEILAVGASGKSSRNRTVSRLASGGGLRREGHRRSLLAVTIRATRAVRCLRNEDGAPSHGRGGAGFPRPVQGAFWPCPRSVRGTG